LQFTLIARCPNLDQNNFSADLQEEYSRKCSQKFYLSDSIKDEEFDQ
jgi:hypothetical protein